MSLYFTCKKYFSSPPCFIEVKLYIFKAYNVMTWYMLCSKIFIAIKLINPSTHIVSFFFWWLCLWSFSKFQVHDITIVTIIYIWSSKLIHIHLIAERLYRFTNIFPFPLSLPFYYFYKTNLFLFFKIPQRSDTI